MKTLFLAEACSFLASSAAIAQSNDDCDDINCENELNSLDYFGSQGFQTQADTFELLDGLGMDTAFLTVQSKTHKRLFVSLNVRKTLEKQKASVFPVCSERMSELRLPISTHVGCLASVKI